MSSISSKDFVPGLLRTSSSLASASNKIPIGEDYSFALLDPEVISITNQIQAKLKNLLGMIVQFVTPETASSEYEDIVEASDRCLEHVAITLDNLKKPAKSLAKISNYDLAKPKLPLRCDNSDTPFDHSLVFKPNEIVPLNISPNHPYLPEIEKLVYTSSQLTLTPIQVARDLDISPLIYVDTEENLNIMVEELENSSEFAVDLEHHNFRSYQGFTCLIQISTRINDYVVDPFPIWDKIPKLLNAFTNPNIVKVFHGADSDVLWLQRDFSIYIVNMFDTGQAARKLMFSSFGLGYLLENLCQVKTDKNYQLADWRVRPLTENHIKYARMDTHYLLQIYDTLKQQLQDKSLSLKLHPFELIKDVFYKSREITMKRYEKPNLATIGVNGIELLDKKQRITLEKILQWRDYVARQEDENPNYILAAKKAIHIAVEKPGDVKDLGKIVQNVSFVKKYAEIVLEIVKGMEDWQEKIEEKGDVNMMMCDNVQKGLEKMQISKLAEVKSVVVHRNKEISYFCDNNVKRKEVGCVEKMENIRKSLKMVFDDKKSQFFNLQKPMIVENKRVEERMEEIPMSVQEKYNITYKIKVPSNRKPSKNPQKRQKISEKKDIRVGWLDNVELQPVKRKNLFKKR
ncbi:hypothetical protein SteCoe_9214 [Stentor coeruleus]|uniref:HRDC domain-containing protein n=1 Tax=Stentor coeruleus TaxID=5963 RepID=A0A1R2CI96_9CILI|nr:hypothetical protein SteCoe_9214 [Stentor coeruleus]